MNKLYRVPKLVTDNGQENTPLIHTASPIVFVHIVALIVHYFMSLLLVSMFATIVYVLILAFFGQIGIKES